VSGDRLAFVRDAIVLADGRRLGETLTRDRWVVDDLLGPVFASGGDGLPRHRLVYLELARGHWKSGGAAAVALAEALVVDEATDVVIAAADRDQAAIVLANIDGYVARNPELGGLLHVRGDERIVADTGSRIAVVTSDAPSAWGHGGTHARFRLVCDELAVWPREEFFVALASSTGKRPDTQTIVLSNAGFDPGRSWQWRVRETARTEPWGYLYSPAGVIASWVSAEWVEQMRALLPPAAFKRVILNEWSTGVGDFVSAEQWAACVDAKREPSVRGEWTRRYTAGLDLGLTKDRTALAVVHREGDRVVLDELQTWQGSSREPLSIETVERALLDVRRRYESLLVRADPWQLAGSIQRLRRAGVAIQEYTFGTGSLQRLSAALYQAITSRALRVFPDAELEAEVLGLVVRETPGGWRIDHRAGGYSDRAIALALALQGALERSEAPYRLDAAAVAPISAGVMEMQW
jgi:phage terminase large subunit-like protein